MKTYDYVDSCLTLDILKMDSGLKKTLKKNWNTFVPQKGDIAYVVENNSDYRFSGTKWVKITKVEEE